MSALLDVVLADRGGGNPRRVPTNGVACSWGVESPGTLSAELELGDWYRRGIADPRGMWITYAHPTAGDWGGVVTDGAPGSDGTYELAAGDWGSTLLDARRLPTKATPSAAPAGSLALRVIAEIATADDYLWIEDALADEDGESVSLTWSRQDARSAFDGLASASGHSWWIDPVTRVFQFRARRGQDRTGQVQLVAGRHLASWSLPRSIDPIRNDLLVVPAVEAYAVSEAFVAENADSIVRFGRRQTELTSAVGVTKSALRPVATATLQRMGLLGASAELGVLDVDGCWSWFREGDSVMVLVPDARARVNLHVMARSIDTDGAVMSVSGIVEGWQEL